MCFYYDEYRRVVHLVLRGSEYICEMTLEQYEAEFGFRASVDLTRTAWER